MKKKLLAILLAAIMVMTLLPTVAFAEGPEPANYTLTLNGAKAVYLMSSVPFALGKPTVAGFWTQNSLDLLTDTLWGKDPFASVNTWSDFYTAYDEGMGSMRRKFNGSNGSFSLTEASPAVEWLLLALTDATATAPGAAYTVYYATSSAEGGAITVDEEEPIATGTLCTDAPSAPNNKANITGKIDAADFAYELIIPADTTLTEDNHKDVLLGADGKVSIKVTKHGADNIDVSYTVDLANGKLTDGGDTTIDTTYKYKQGTNEFAEIIDDDDASATKVTVYTGGEVVDSFVNVTADKDDWDAAPVGDYNATVVFNFEDETITPTTVADVASEVDHLTINNESKYYGLKYEENSLNLYDENDEPEKIIATLPGTTALTASGGNWTCTVDDVTYLFTMEEGSLESITVNGMSESTANGKYTGGKK